MRHVIVLAVLFVGPLTAAPVPKGLRVKPPSVVGTVWVDLDGEESPREYTFTGDGKFVIREGGDFVFGGTWKQVGDTLRWEVGDGFLFCTLAFKDGKFEGKAGDTFGQSRAMTLTPKDK